MSAGNGTTGRLQRRTASATALPLAAADAGPRRLARPDHDPGMVASILGVRRNVTEATGRLHKTPVASAIAAATSRPRPLGARAARVCECYARGEERTGSPTRRRALIKGRSRHDEVARAHPVRKGGGLALSSTIVRASLLQPGRTEGASDAGEHTRQGRARARRTETARASASTTSTRCGGTSRRD